ncbi:MAG: XRE family transcriptional regulator [Ruminococcus sp.]|nr:XRE family transcriptional regulator [Ruminococcus sp.]
MITSNIRQTDEKAEWLEDTAEQIEDGIEQLKQCRKDFGLSQQEVAKQAGISRTYLADLESGRSKLTDSMKERLKAALERLDPDHGLYLLVDYVRIRFKTTDTQYVINHILGMKIEHMIYEEYGRYGYEEHYAFGNIVVYSTVDEEKGTLLELKGQGSREFEGILEAQGRNWFDFFLKCINEGCVFKRIDLAINDVRGILNIPELTEKCYEKECKTLFRTFKSYRSGELIKREEKIGMGHTLYIGSLSSDAYFCLYEKDYEQYIKAGIPIDEVPVKNRFEIRLMNDRAEHAVMDLLERRDADSTAFDIINRYIRFLDRDDTKEKDEWEVNDRWAWFLGENRGKLKLTSDPKPFSIRRTLNWFSHQVCPTWKFLEEKDKLEETSVMKDMFDNAQMSKRHETFLKQSQLKPAEVIYQEWEL